MNRPSNQWRLVLGGAFFALMFFYIGVNAFFYFVQVGSYTGWRGYSNDGRHFYTSGSDPNGPTAALRPGDEILAINGISPAEDFSVLELPDRVPPGTALTMTVSRNGQVFTLQTRMASFPPGKYPYGSWDRLWLLVNGVLFLVTGLIVLLLKAENRQAWLLALMLGTFVGVITNYYPYSVLGTTVEALIAVAKVAAWWFFPLFPIFFLNFPERSPLLERFPRLKAWIYWSMYVLLLPYWQPGRMPTRLRVWYANLPGLHWWLDLGSKYSIPVLLIVAYLTAGFFFMVLSYRIASAESRKRMRVAILGSVKNYAYRERAVTLAPGDVVAWLSDGFTECFNEAGEMLGDEAASMTLAQSAHLAPSEIVNHFVRVSDEWAGARPQDDDVTLVVVKARACSGREAA